jgi:3-hydroxyisobutyrate dehydrogenase-like beta-hydroxyacid dehydrogenase
MVIDTTTGDPAQAMELAGKVRSSDAVYLDAAISGSSAQLRTGDAVVLVGGDADAVARCDDLFRSFARSTIHAGEAGSGAKLKLVTNLVLGLNRAALAEGLTLARSFEIEPELAFRALKEGAAYSRVMEAKGPKMLAGDFSPEARLSQHLKDVRLMLTADVRLPLTETHRALLERAETLGFGAADNSAVIKALE